MTDNRGVTLAFKQIAEGDEVGLTAIAEIPE